MSPRPRCGIAPPPPALGGGGGGGAIPPSSNPDIPSPPQGLGERPDSTPVGRTMWEGSDRSADTRSQPADSTSSAQAGSGCHEPQSSSNGGSRSRMCTTAPYPQ